MVDIGPDGTDNDVLFKISSDANDFSCEVKLSTFGDDWHKNDREIWPASEFGDCAKQYIKVINLHLFYNYLINCYFRLMMLRYSD